MAGWTSINRELIEWEGSIRATNNLLATKIGVAGVTNPTAAIDVNGSIITDGYFTHFNNAGIFLSGLSDFATGLVSGPDDSLQLRAGSSTPRIYMSGAVGYVGMGTAVPLARLHVSGANTAQVITGTATSANFRVQGNGTGTLDIGNVTGGNAYMQVTDTGNLALAYNLVLQSNGGFVGIGTTAPVSALNVSGGAATSITVQTGTGQSHIIMQDTSIGKQYAFVGRGTDFAIRETGVIDVMTFQAGGGVGINTFATGASHKLQVSGASICVSGAGVQPKYFVNASGGIIATITSADLVGKSILVSGGIIVGYG